MQKSTLIPLINSDTEHPPRALTWINHLMRLYFIIGSGINTYLYHNRKHDIANQDILEQLAGPVWNYVDLLAAIGARRLLFEKIFRHREF